MRRKWTAGELLSFVIQSSAQRCYHIFPEDEQMYRLILHLHTWGDQQMAPAKVKECGD